MSYSTQPGTVAHRVVMFLRANPGQEYTSADLSDRLDVDQAGFATFMQAARQAGLVKATEQLRNSRRTLVWSYGDGVPLPRPETDKPLPGKTDVTVKPGPLLPGKTGDEPDAVLSCRTGELTIVGIDPQPDGRVILPRQLVENMKRLLTWSPA